MPFRSSTSYNNWCRLPSIFPSVYPYVRKSICLSVCLSLHPRFYIYVPVSLCLRFHLPFRSQSQFILITIQCVYFVRNLSRNSITNLPEGLFAKADKIHAMWVIADTKQIEKEKNYGMYQFDLKLEWIAYTCIYINLRLTNKSFFGLLSFFHSSSFLLTHHFILLQSAIFLSTALPRYKRECLLACQNHCDLCTYQNALNSLKAVRV